jgi:membrane fusion protein, heavy metal efflux system
MRGLVAVLGLIASSIAVADANHGAKPGATALIVVDSPQRLPDGAVFMPKRSQRQLGLRTLIVESAEVPQAVELAARVVQDPNAGGRVQAMQAGRIEAGPRGLPALGQSVRRGDVLGYVVPSMSALDLGTQRAQLAELRAQRELSERKVARLRQLEGTVAAKEVEAAESQVRSAGDRMAALQSALGSRESLAAPVTGVIASANAVLGQVIDAREIVFEIVDPTRLRIEALAYEPALAREVGAANLRAADGSTSPLEFIGAGSILKDQATPLAFRLASGAQPRAVGEMVTVVMTKRTKVSGVPVPAASVVKSPANEDIVWVHERAERFVARRVRTAPLDGSW